MVGLEMEPVSLLDTFLFLCSSFDHPFTILRGSFDHPITILLPSSGPIPI